MITRNSLRTFFIGAATVIAGVIFILTLIKATLYAPTGPTFAAPTDEPGRELLYTVDFREEPALLSIPILGIDADVQKVGITSSGAMGIPDNYRDVAWYRNGTVPGQIGSAVMDGHVDNALGLPGVFGKLDTLKRGDHVFVTTEAGTRLRFAVIGVEEYPYQEIPSDVIFNLADSARLNLITCGGEWNKADHTYDTRVVVYTMLDPEA